MTCLRGAVVLVLGLLLAGCTSAAGPDADGGPAADPPDVEAEESPSEDDLRATPNGSAPDTSGDGDDDPPGDDADATAGDEQVTVEVHFRAPGGQPEQTAPVRRTVPGPALLEGAMRALLAGPTEAEREAGRESWFSAETADLLRGVGVEGRTAAVDFDARMREVIPNASTSSGSAALLASLDATATQFATVDEAVYALNGDVEAFYTWLQLVPPGR